MRLAYPASHLQSRLNDSLLALKIARHSPCSVCTTCPGLHPPPGIDVVLDEQFGESSLGDLEQYGSDDDDIPSTYLEQCECGHGTRQHNADESELGRGEFERRSRVAIRLDELLQVLRLFECCEESMLNYTQQDSGRLLDFDYDDEDITSLRRQMTHHVSKMTVSNSSPGAYGSLVAYLANTPPGAQLHSAPASPASSVLSDIPIHPSKKRRVSASSLSGADDGDDDDEEDRPLAARMTVGTSSKSRPPVGKRSGKKAPGKKSKKAHTAPTSLAPPVGEEQAQMNGKINTNGYETKVKVEDKMDEGQLTRLAAGVTIDSGARTSAGPPTRTEKAGPAELRKGVIQVIAVENDGQPRSFVVLTGLKALFQKQLPKMPREYIARLVYDCNSKALAIVKRGYKAVGGICYRPFPHRGFAEIVFFATNSVYQDKGYGGMLMDYFKAHIKKIYPDMMHFLTYADNYAVGYFEKQGFSKDITLDRSVWAGYIKDYEGGTIMQCTMVRKVDYPEKAKIVAVQQEAIMTKIREMSKSHIVHRGLPQFQEGAPEGVTVDPKNVPGLRESGWTPEMTANPIRPGPRGADFRFMDRALRDLKVYSQSWPFLTPVNGDDVPDYYDVVKNPMDFSTMEDKLGAKRYDSVEAFAADVQLIIDNCRLYNPETTIYTKCANKLEKYFKEMLEDRFKRDD